MTHLWITGASQGIGRAVALAAAQRGWTVSATARGEAGLAALVAEGGGRISAFPGDITDRAGLAAVVEAVEAANGPITVAVLNAGTHQPTDGAAFDPSVYDRLIAVNLGGAINSVAAILPRFTARKSGRLALVSSVAAYRGLPKAGAYCASKAAVTALAESLRLDLAGLGVAVQVIHPGFVRTPLTDKNAFPMPFLMEPEAAAARIIAGLEGDGFEIAFPRRFIYILKLLRLLPYRLYFALVARQTGVSTGL
jgi:NAD(P)-dependent dehydrogenase (short-subunit alcohol dehydrogenase family)